MICIGSLSNAARTECNDMQVQNLHNWKFNSVLGSICVSIRDIYYEVKAWSSRVYIQITSSSTRVTVLPD